jgi:pilus assembly protein Flp/PilA
MMHAFVRRAGSFLRSTDGPTATEYAIMLALIVLVAVAAISSLGTKTSSVFSTIDGSIPTPGGG